ncbi:hypothetical protein CO661_32490 [Sinorhizobium fredii]|uniref:Uncharacterized protein n=1 Tax=Rhizobium fredii TaxID=380 RepID=A0A2A6LNJ9_RHIFR|nr:hypothetical protein CO661_32490 [Sinorhizobium fredii]
MHWCQTVSIELFAPPESGSLQLSSIPQTDAANSAAISTGFAEDRFSRRCLLEPAYPIRDDVKYTT